MHWNRSPTFVLNFLFESGPFLLKKCVSHPSRQKIYEIMKNKIKDWEPKERFASRILLLILLRLELLCIESESETEKKPSRKDFQGQFVNFFFSVMPTVKRAYYNNQLQFRRDSCLDLVQTNTIASGAIFCGQRGLRISD